MRISDWSSDVCSSDLGQADEGEALLHRSLQLDASYPGVPAVTLAFVLSQRGELEEAERILDQMPSPSNMEPQFMMVRAVVLARQGDLAAARAQWTRLLAYTRQPADAAPVAVLGRFMITPAVIQDRKSTRLNSVTNARLVCRLLLGKTNSAQSLICSRAGRAPPITR